MKLIADIKELIATDFASETLQAINRIRCRIPVDSDGNCNSCDIYITLPAKGIDTRTLMLGAISNEMKNINISKFSHAQIGSDKELERYSLVDSFLCELEYQCNKDKTVGVKLEDIAGILQLSKEQYKGIKKSITFKNTIDKEYKVYLQPVFDKKGRKKDICLYYKK